MCCLAIFGAVHQNPASPRISTRQPLGHTAQPFELQNTFSRLFSMVCILLSSMRSLDKEWSTYDAHCKYGNLHDAHKMPCTTHASMHSAPLRKKSDALRSSARSGYLMSRLRHGVSRPCDAICAVLEPSAVLRVVRCGRCCSHTSCSATS